MKTKIRFSQPFTDGTIFPDTQKAYSEIEVDDNVLAKIKSSGGEFEILGKVIPKSSVKKVKKAQPKEQVIDDE